MFGINIKKVKEINRNANYIKIPLTEEYIAGLFNMRGQVVTIFDLANLLNLKDCKNKNKSCIILKTKTDSDDYIGFLIDKPGDVIDIEEKWCEPASANLEKDNSFILQKIAKLKEFIIMIIDSDKIINYKI